MPDICRLVEIRGIAEGTGFLVGPGIILTAWHLVRAEAVAHEPVIIRVQGDLTNKFEASQVATVLWPKSSLDPGSDLDFALLVVSESTEDLLSVNTFVPWGSIGNWGDIQVTAVGYPDQAIDRQSGRRDTKGVTGWIQSADRVRARAIGSGTLTMRLRDEDCPSQPPAVAWPAMSGAPVFAEDVLIGMVVLAGAEASRHQLRVLPIDRLFSEEAVIAALRSTGRPLPEPAHSSKPSDSQAKSTEDVLFTDKLKFRYSNEIDLDSGIIGVVLNAYYQDLLSGKLDNFKFGRDKLEFDNSSGYDRLRANLQHGVFSIKVRRVVEQYEKWLVDGILLILNHHYLADKQVHFCCQSLFWFCKSIRVTIYSLFSEAGLDIAPVVTECDLEEDLVFTADPLNYFAQNRLYGSKTIKIDVWHPKTHIATSAYLPRSSYIGEWFDNYPQMSGPLSEHWSPNDYYNFIIPQMLLRHFINRGPLITNWDGFLVGAA